MRKFFLGLAFCLGAASTFAQTNTDIKTNGAYSQDGRGTVARNPFGLCWRTGYWTPADAVPGCDGELTPPLVQPIAPPISPASAAAAPATPKRCDFAVTLGSDETFAFNKAILTSAAKKRLDEDVLPKLDNCTRIETILVTGHSDRLGSQQYNQRLSEKRAEAVVAYLKNKGVTADTDVLGAGKTQSIKACDDKLPHPQLIECLAPNRRVTIEARGMAK